MSYKINGGKDYKIKNEQLVAAYLKKVTCVKQVTKNLESRIRAKFDLNEGEFSLKSKNNKKKISLNSPTFGTKGGGVLSAQDGNTLWINVNVNKLFNSSMLELTSLISAKVYSSALYKKVQREYNEKKSKNAEKQAINREQTQESESGESSETAAEKKDAAASISKQILKNYIKDYLQKYYKGSLDGNEIDFEEVSELIAEDLIESGKAKTLPNAKTIEDYLGEYFDTRYLEGKNPSEISGDDLVAARVSKIKQKAAELALDPSKKPQMLGYMEQANALMKLSANAKFIDTNNKSDLKEFCVTYANEFMSANNLKPIQIIFVNNIDQFGVFGEKGGSPYIKINLDKAGSSRSELLMTLSHELTHAVESSSNKLKGEFNRETGSGLVDSISEKIGVDKSNENYQLLADLANFCYHLNPHERTAREGELSGLMFAKKMYEDNPDSKLAMEIDKSINGKGGYVEYQQQTINIANQLSSPGQKSLEEFTAKVEALKNTDPTAYAVASKRIQYLQQRLTEIENEKRENGQMKEQGLIDNAKGLGVSNQNPKKGDNINKKILPLEEPVQLGG